MPNSEVAIAEADVHAVLLDPAQWYVVDPLSEAGGEDHVAMRHQKLSNVYACLFFSTADYVVKEIYPSQTLRALLGAISTALSIAPHALGVQLIEMLSARGRECVVQWAIKELRQ